MIFLLITHPSCLTHLRINEFVVFHIQRGVFSPLKRPPNHKHSDVTTQCKSLDQMFADESSNPSFCTVAFYTEQYVGCFSVIAHRFVLATCASAAVSLLAQVLCWFFADALCAPQSQHQDDHMVGSPLGEEGEAAWEVWGWRYVDFTSLDMSYIKSPITWLHDQPAIIKVDFAYISPITTADFSLKNSRCAFMFHDANVDLSAGRDKEWPQLKERDPSSQVLMDFYRQTES